MDTIRQLKSVAELHTARLEEYLHGKLSPSAVRYDESFDALRVLFGDPSLEATVFYLNDHIALLYHHLTDDVVGVMVEGFAQHFLPHHEGLMRDLQIRGVADRGLLRAFFAGSKPASVTSEVAKATEAALGGFGTILEQVPA